MSLRIAYCFSGHLRTFERTVASFQQNLLAIAPGDVFMHTWDTLGGIGRTHWGGDPDDHVTQYLSQETCSLVASLYNPVSFEIESHSLATRMVSPRYDASNPSSLSEFIYLMWYGMLRADQLRREYEKLYAFRYDRVVRLRPDLVFDTQLNIEQLLDPDVLYFPRNDNNFRALSVPDAFFHGSPALVEAAIDFVQHIDRFLFKRGGSAEDGFSDYLEHLELPISLSDICFRILRLPVGDAAYYPQIETTGIPERLTKGLRKVKGYD